MNLEKFTDRAKGFLQSAQTGALSRGHQQFLPEHVLKVLLDDEIAPGTLWQAREDLAIDSIRKLKALAGETGAEIWPNHDMAFWRTLRQFPEFHA